MSDLFESNDDDEGQHDDDDLEDEIGPLERLLSEEPGPLPFRGLEGPVAPVEMPEPIPEATPQTMICLRGPCKHYLAIETRFNAGNTKGTLKRKPRAQNRFCLIASDSTELTDELVEDCSKWEPMETCDANALIAKRKHWLDEHAEEVGLKYNPETLAIEKEV